MTSAQTRKNTRAFGFAIATALLIVPLTFLPAASAAPTGPAVCQDNGTGSECYGRYNSNCWGRWDKNATGNETDRSVYCVYTLPPFIGDGGIGLT